MRYEKPCSLCGDLSVRVNEEYSSYLLRRRGRMGPFVWFCSLAFMVYMYVLSSFRFDTKSFAYSTSTDLFVLMRSILFIYGVDDGG